MESVDRFVQSARRKAGVTAVEPASSVALLRRLYFDLIGLPPPVDIVDDQIDAISKSMLGLTVSCARCRDHKFDPIPTRDYYSLADVFRSTDTFYGGGVNRPETSPEKIEVYLSLPTAQNAEPQEIQNWGRHLGELQDQHAKAEKKAKQLNKKLPDNWRKKQAKLEQSSDDLAKADRKVMDRITEFQEVQDRLDELKTEIEALRQASPELEFALGVNDAEKIKDWPIQIRGAKNKREDVVPRGFLSCVEVSEAGLPADQQSGRLELAEWMTHPRHPLTSRVIVNRVWQHLFGLGLVPTVDNFGRSGQPPSHPQLLDYLAHRFVHEHGWSIKSLIRELVLTRTYRLSSTYSTDNYASDPENRWLWRHARRRLEAEPLRDAMLATSGNLIHARFDGSLVEQIGEGEVGRNLDISCLDEPFPYRSVYLPIIRGIIPKFLQVFDLPEPSNVQGERDISTVPTQALLLMNSPFVIEQARHLAEQALERKGSDVERIGWLYKRALSRAPTEKELSQALQFLGASSGEVARDSPSSFTSTGTPSAESRKASQEQDSEPTRELPDTPEADAPLESSDGLDKWTSLCHAIYASAEFRYLD